MSKCEPVPQPAAALDCDRERGGARRDRRADGLPQLRASRPGAGSEARQGTRGPWLRCLVGRADRGRRGLRGVHRIGARWFRRRGRRLVARVRRFRLGARRGGEGARPAQARSRVARWRRTAARLSPVPVHQPVPLAGRSGIRGDLEPRTVPSTPRPARRDDLREPPSTPRIGSVGVSRRRLLVAAAGATVAGAAGLVGLASRDCSAGARPPPATASPCCRS